jgi:hypothetical protein
MKMKWDVTFAQIMLQLKEHRAELIDPQYF